MKIQHTFSNVTPRLQAKGPQPEVQGQEPPNPQEKVDLTGGPQPPHKPWGKILVKTAVAGGLGALLGAGMAAGGVGGFISGVVGGSIWGVSALSPAGNGKGADGLLYTGSGLVLGGAVGALAGAYGLPHGALIGGAAFGLLTLLNQATKKD